MNRKLQIAISFSLAVAGAGCLGRAPTSEPTGENPAPVDPTGATDGTGSGTETPATGETTGGESNTFDHESSEVDPFEVLSRIQEEGAPEISTRMHSCQKLKYKTLGNVLTQLGVDLNATGKPATAGQLYKGGAQALGSPNYGARVAEAVENTTAGATKLFDIFTRAANDIIAAMPNQDACKVAGAGAQMFDDQGKCTVDGISCLQGAPATEEQVALCNQALTQASTADIGKTIAVATILSAAHTCE